MDVILLERVAKLGAMGDVVAVKDGFARNYLLPTGKALRASKANKAKFEADRSALEAQNAEKRSAAESESSNLDGKTFTLIRQAGESGQLYGSVSPRDIAEAASSDGLAVTRNHVMLEAPIKTVGLFPVQVQLHPEVTVAITINVARSTDEAEAQERGEVLTGPSSDRAEARAAAEELFAEEEEENGDFDGDEAEAAPEDDASAEDDDSKA